MWRRFAPHPFAIYPINESGEMIKYEDVSKGWAMNTAEPGEVIHVAEHGVVYTWEMQDAT